MRMGVGSASGRVQVALPGRSIGALAVILLCCMATLSGCNTAKTSPTSIREAERSRLAALRASGPPSRVIVITVAGLSSSDFLAADGYIAMDPASVRMPNLARLAREGIVAERALPPSPGSSYAAHATLMTGNRPSRHGVIADTQLKADGTSSLPYWDSGTLKTTPLWDAAIGRGVLALNWPTTVGARIELLLPEARSADVNQPWLEFMKTLSSPFLTRQLEVIAAGEEATAKGEDGQERSASSWPTPSEKDAAIAELACHVALSDRDPGLWLLRFTQSEAALRLTGARTEVVASALHRIDAEIGTLLDCLEESGQLADTAVFVIGDVAYAPVHTRVDPNVALVRAGLVGRDPRSSMGVRGWLAVARSQGRSAYVYAKDAENALAARRILEAEAARTGAFRVVPAAELARTDVDPQAWFGLAASPGYSLGNGLSKPMLRPAVVRAAPGALRAEGDDSNAVGFVAWGRGVRRRVRLPEFDFVDFAPTVSKLFGLRLGENVEGRPIDGILRAEIPLPPPGPKRLGVDNDGDAERTLREMGGGR